MTDLERFMSHVTKTESCWEWTAAKNEKGYGVVGVGGRTYKAHRWLYAITIGSIPESLCLLHSCDNPSCVNPAHLVLGTRADNNKDMCDKGRHATVEDYTKEGCYPRGENHHAARLTANMVAQLREDRSVGMSYSKLSSKYGISSGHCHRIVNNKAWRHTNAG